MAAHPLRDGIGGQLSQMRKGRHAGTVEASAESIASENGCGTGRMRHWKCDAALDSQMRHWTVKFCRENCGTGDAALDVRKAPPPEMIDFRRPVASQ